ncbi:MAG: hypothetical protein Q9226_004072 [Calogaya cf. arnoldii]
MARNKTIRQRKIDTHIDSTPAQSLVSLPSEVLCMVVKQLDDFEDLVSSPTGAGLQYVTSIRITTHTSPLLIKHIRRDLPGVNTEPKHGGIYFPSTLTSTHLNTLVRLLLRRLPERSLTEFIWDHACFMNSQTFQLLLRHNRPSLRTVKIHNYNHDLHMVWEVGVPGIGSLSINNMDDSGASSVVGDLISRNPKSSKHLCLGAEDAAVRECQLGFSMVEEKMNINVRKMVDYIKKDFDDYKWREAADDWTTYYHGNLKQRGPFTNP